MIKDHIRNYKKYLELNHLFAKAFEFIRDASSEMPDGKYILDGENLYASVQSYETEDKMQRQWESHEKYIDIQYIIYGKERIFWREKNSLSQKTAYNAEMDVEFFDGARKEYIVMNSGCFCIFYPNDAHMPCCNYAGSHFIKKIVVKVKV